MPLAADCLAFKATGFCVAFIDSVRSAATETDALAIAGKLNSRHKTIRKFISSPWTTAQPCLSSNPAPLRIPARPDYGLMRTAHEACLRRTPPYFDSSSAL
jgi:hypothetical protein